MTHDPATDAPEPSEPLEPVEGEPGWAADDPVQGSGPAASPDPVRTGSAQVDEVIRAVEELEERPIEEHVGVFESAQVQLRRALDEPGEVAGAATEQAADQPGHG